MYNVCPRARLHACVYVHMFVCVPVWVSADVFQRLRAFIVDMTVGVPFLDQKGVTPFGFHLRRLWLA